MNLLIIEDQAEFIQRVAEACAHNETVKLLQPADVGLIEDYATDEPLEDQLLKKVAQIVEKYSIDLVLLDTDLSRQRELRTQTEYRQAFQTVGIPVCRYRKGHSTTPLASAELVRRMALEGTSAIWVPRPKLEGDLATTLIPWLQKVQRGFAELKDALAGKSLLIADAPGPAWALAVALDRPDVHADLLGYTAQNFFFFIPTGVAKSNELHTAMQLGYWLHNYILTFPGPILNRIAAAAYLNLKLESFDLPKVQDLLRSACYAGPFRDVEPYYWREDLGKILDENQGDIAMSPQLEKTDLQRVSASSFAYYCVLTREIITAEEAATNPDWIPVGAQLSRIKESVLDELGPMLVS